jgi:hypothetical protein
MRNVMQPVSDAMKMITTIQHKADVPLLASTAEILDDGVVPVFLGPESSGCYAKRFWKSQVLLS